MNNPLKNLRVETLTATEGAFTSRVLGDNWSEQACSDIGLFDAEISFANGNTVIYNPNGNFTKLSTNAYIAFYTNNVESIVIAKKIKEIVNDTTVIVDSDISVFSGPFYAVGVSYPKYRYIKLVSPSEPFPYIQFVQYPLYYPFEIQSNDLIAPFVVSTSIYVQILTIE